LINLLGVYHYDAHGATVEWPDFIWIRHRSSGIAQRQQSTNEGPDDLDSRLAHPVSSEPAQSGEEADETGIAVAGKDKNGHGYVLADISGRYPPTEWARLAITAYDARGRPRDDAA
jgi:phage terminase large subunit-like protein